MSFDVTVICSFEEPSSFDSFLALVHGFSSKILHLLSVSHTAGLLGHGKSLMFISPLLKRWAIYRLIDDRNGPSFCTDTTSQSWQVTVWQYE